MKKEILLLISIFYFALSINAQSIDSNIDPKWKRYYEQNPSGIENNHQSSDFIKIIDLVNFIPRSKTYNQDVNFMKKVLLMLDQNDLEQMNIDGWWGSVSKKHDDYYLLYNMTYNKINKETWDRLCPYLIPLMNVDQTIKIN